MSARTETQKVAAHLQERMEGPVIEARPYRVVVVDLIKSGKHVQEWDGHVLVRVNGVEVRGGQ